MTTNNTIDRVISPLIPAQFPAFYQSSGNNFITFMQEYYNWLEQVNTTQYLGSVTTESRNLLDYFNVDLTKSSFYNLFKDEFLSDFPENIAVSFPFLVKHILELYTSKGTEESFETLFRILYNIDAKINTPGKYMFRLSNGNWKIPKYIEVSDSIFINDLIGERIRGSSGATAVVESFNQKVINRKTVNVLYLSNMTGDFVFGDLVTLDGLDMFGQEPIVIGSLSAISIENGGFGFTLGEVVNVLGNGFGGKGRVSSIKTDNGKVAFKLIDGGYGFSKDALVTIDNTDTGGTGASFKIGGLTDQQNISLCTDSLFGLVAMMMELPTAGFRVNIINASENFTNGERAYGTAYTRHIAVNYLFTPGGVISNGELLSNSILGIANLTTYIADQQDLYLTGGNADLNNANLVVGTILVSDITQAVAQVVFTSPTYNTFANGIVIGSGSNTTVLAVDRPDANDIGYYVTNMAITGLTSGATATVVNTVRLTDWEYFPFSIGPSNLDSILKNTLTYETKTIGKITYLSHQNPGDGYITPPKVSIVEPLIFGLKIDDGKGGYWGDDTIVSASAGGANGIVTSLIVIDSGVSYTADEFLTIISANNDTSIVGRAVVSTSGVGEGFWSNTQSFLSDIMVLQDSDYYQVYSYEINTEKMLSEYESYVKQLVHPVGYKLFGKYSVKRDLTNLVEGGMLTSSDIYQKDVNIPLTADITLLTTDTSTYSADVKGYKLA